VRQLAGLPAAAVCAVALACASAPPPLPAPGSVRGHLAAAGGEPAPASELLLVFLEPLDAASAPAERAPRPILRSGEHGLAPAALAVPAGGSIRFANESAIYHHIFSYSEPNRFDLGVVRRGEARTIELRHPGVVRVYCRLHPAERAVVFVAPSPYFATFQPPAPYEIRQVPPGRYRLHAWSENGAAAGPALTVPSGASVAAEIAALPAAAE
jgi:plastocyanin